MSPNRPVFCEDTCPTMFPCSAADLSAEFPVSPAGSPSNRTWKPEPAGDEVFQAHRSSVLGPVLIHSCGHQTPAACLNTSRCSEPFANVGSAEHFQQAHYSSLEFSLASSEPWAVTQQQGSAHNMRNAVCRRHQEAELIKNLNIEADHHYDIIKITWSKLLDTSNEMSNQV